MTAVACVALMAVAAPLPTSVTSPAPIAQRAAGAEAGGAGALGRPGDDDGVAARVLVRVEARPGIVRAATATGRLAKVRGRDLASSTLAGMPMSATLHRRRTGARPGSSRWPGFRRKKVTVRGGLHHRTVGAAGRAVEPARHIDRHHRLARRVDGRDDLGRGALERPGQARAEQRVDDEVGAARASPATAARSPPLPARRHGGGIALERVAARRAARARTRWPALAQQARGHEAVAAVVAGPAGDRHLAPPRPAQACDRPPRPRRGRQPPSAPGRARPRRWPARSARPISSAVSSSCPDKARLSARQRRCSGMAASCARDGPAPMPHRLRPAFRHASACLLFMQNA